MGHKENKMKEIQTIIKELKEQLKTANEKDQEVIESMIEFYENRLSNLRGDGI